MSMCSLSACALSLPASLMKSSPSLRIALDERFLVRSMWMGRDMRRLYRRLCCLDHCFLPPFSRKRWSQNTSLVKNFCDSIRLPKRESANSTAILRNVRCRTCAFLWLWTAENRDEIFQCDNCLSLSEGSQTKIALHAERDCSRASSEAHSVFLGTSLSRQRSAIVFVLLEILGRGVPAAEFNYLQLFSGCMTAPAKGDIHLLSSLPFTFSF